MKRYHCTLAGSRYMFRGSEFGFEWTQWIASKYASVGHVLYPSLQTVNCLL